MEIEPHLVVKKIIFNIDGGLTMKKLMKKIIGICLTSIMIFSTSISAFANEYNITEVKDSYSKEDIMQLEPYITSENGFFEFDYNKAIKDGFSKDLVYGQKEFLDKLNSEANKGNIVIESDLEITTYNDIDSPVLLRSCPGKNTSFEYHWWGYSRYADNCETKRIVSDLNTAAAAGTMAGGAVGVVSAVFPATAPIAVPIAGGIAIDSGYCWLLATRIDANNNGRGVYIEMTWVLVFDITPQ